MLKKEQFLAVLLLGLFRLSFGVRVIFPFSNVLFSHFSFFIFQIFLGIIANINLGIVHNGIDEIMVACIYIP